MSIENHKYIAARAIIVDENNKVLLGRRGRGVGFNQYALIGGKPDQGETIEQSIIREVEEEVGLKFIDPILWIETSDNKTIPEQTWHVYFFVGGVSGEIKLKKDEVIDVVFAGEEDLDRLDIALNHREVLAQLFRERIGKK